MHLNLWGIIYVVAMLTRTTETSVHFKINWDWRTASFSSWPYTQRQPSSSCTKFFVKTSEEEDFSFFVVTFHMGIWWPHHSCREMHQSLEKMSVNIIAVVGMYLLCALLFVYYWCHHIQWYYQHFVGGSVQILIDFWRCLYPVKLEGLGIINALK